MTYLKRISIALDQLANTVLGGWPDETLCARVYRNSQESLLWSIFRWALDLLFFFDWPHCELSYYAEYQRKHSPKEYRP